MTELAESYELEPIFDDGQVALYVADCRDLLPTLGAADLVLTDPPYGETSLRWDVPVTGWLPLVDAPQLWTFGSMRMALGGAYADWTGWRFAQDLVWRKHNGSGFHKDRFKRVHEFAMHFYRGPWGALYREVPTTADATARAVRRKRRPPHMGHIERGSYVSHDGGPRLQRSVIEVRSCHGYAISPTQKPLGILRPLIECSCPPGGRIIDPFAGAASTLVAARQTGRRAIGIELDAEQAEKSAWRLAHPEREKDQT